MFPLDPKTLSLLVGLGNLVFALLATLYIHKTKTRNPALEIWRWGRLLAGCGFIANLLSSTVPNAVPPVLGNMLQVLGGTLDIAAYCLLLAQQRWQKLLGIFAIASLLGLLLVSFLADSQSPRLLLFSALGVVFYGILAGLTLRASKSDWLLKLIGCIDLMLALVLLMRVAKGLAFSPVVRFDNDLITTLLYITLFLVVMINGFGFLLLVKQKDDRVLYQALDDLARVDEQRHEFLAQASHEFRTPAALIKASLDSLRFLQSDLPAPVLQRLNNIRLATQRLTDLSNTLLTHDRLSKQSMLFQPVRLDLLEALCDALKLYPPEARIEARIEAHLPSAPIYLQADPVQLRIALQNLIDNALEHNPPDSGPVCINLRSTEAFIDICVADTGSGIPDHEKQNIFTRFYGERGNFTRGGNYSGTWHASC